MQLLDFSSDRVSGPKGATSARGRGAQPNHRATSGSNARGNEDEIAEIVRIELVQVMDSFGYGILEALVTVIEPDGRVKESMNEINAAQRMRLAATEKGEADRILRVKAAEGEAQSKALQGRGIADQRQAVVAGLRESFPLRGGNAS
jgi:regulator of protease activity HflC (stomatin/prohibitin superfamily)